MADYCSLPYLFFFFNDTATTEIYTLSLHDALPIGAEHYPVEIEAGDAPDGSPHRSEEHTSELQSRRDLVCRLLLEKKKTIAENLLSYNIETKTNLTTVTQQI